MEPVRRRDTRQPRAPTARAQLPPPRLCHTRTHTHTVTHGHTRPHTRTHTQHHLHPTTTTPHDSRGTPRRHVLTMGTMDTAPSQMRLDRRPSMSVGAQNREATSMTANTPATHTWNSSCTVATPCCACVCTVRVCTVRVQCVCAHSAGATVAVRHATQATQATPHRHTTHSKRAQQHRRRSKHKKDT